MVEHERQQGFDHAIALQRKLLFAVKNILSDDVGHQRSDENMGDGFGIGEAQLRVLLKKRGDKLSPFLNHGLSIKFGQFWKPHRLSDNQPQQRHILLVRNLIQEDLRELPQQGFWFALERIRTQNCLKSPDC